MLITLFLIIFLAGRYEVWRMEVYYLTVLFFKILIKSNLPKKLKFQTSLLFYPI